MKKIILPLLLLFSATVNLKSADNYDNFGVAIYCTIFDVMNMADENYLEENIRVIEKSFKIDKVYLETHRKHTLIDEQTLLKVKSYFEKRGIATAGGITTTGERPAKGGFGLFCYSNEEDKKYIIEITKFTAKYFDEIIFDDFYFTSCRCADCVERKGNRSWSDFRIQTKRDFSREVVKAAKAVNPNVKMVIKYPNWYEFYQFTGYNLQDESAIFDGIYTGTETRDPEYHQQHLQPYHGYSIMRYLENVKPGLNGGGWVDPASRRYLDRYAEQLELTLFAKAKEITLFHFGSLIEQVHKNNSEFKTVSSVAPTAGYVFDKTDCFLGKLGNPTGLASYRPFHSSGETYLHSYLGMVGIPIELTPEFPVSAQTVLLTEAAKYDSGIIEKMKKHLIEGKNIIITSGLLKALQDKGMEEITSSRCSNSKITATAFSDLKYANFYPAKKPVTFPGIDFATNDSWMEVIAWANGTSYPVILKSTYGEGLLFILTVPDNFTGLYEIPEETLTKIKQYILGEFEISIEAPGKVALFLYDNNSFIVHSFLPYRTDVNIVFRQKGGKLMDLISDKELKVEVVNGKVQHKTSVAANSYKVFKWEPGK